MKIGKGDIAAQRRRYRKRYPGRGRGNVSLQRLRRQLRQLRSTVKSAQ